MIALVSSLERSAVRSGPCRARRALVSNMSARKPRDVAVVREEVSYRPGTRDYPAEEIRTLCRGSRVVTLQMTRFRHRAPLVLLSVWAVCGTSGAKAETAAALPPWTGPYPVGRVTYDWTDSSRRDVLAPDGAWTEAVPLRQAALSWASSSAKPKRTESILRKQRRLGARLARRRPTTLYRDGSPSRSPPAGPRNARV
jgi:hypothetical protein